MENCLLGEKTIADSISLEILTSSSQIPPMPTNRLKLLDMTHQPIDKIDIFSLVKLLEVDPGLFGKVLQLANSPFYRGVENIISLRTAITRIGLTETLNSVCLYCFQNTLPQFHEVEGFSSKEYWAFSWACATAARRLGHPNLRMKSLPGELYMTGLLHGIGKLMMAIHYPGDFSKCVLRAKMLKQPLHKMELDVFGTVDGLVASKIMESWNLPANICDGVAYYQMPEYAPEEFREIAGLTQFAYYIASMADIGSNGDGCPMDLAASDIAQQQHLKLSSKSVQDEVVQEILASVQEKSESVAGVAPKTSSADTQPVRKPEPVKRQTISQPQEKKADSNLFQKVLSWFSRIRT